MVEVTTAVIAVAVMLLGLVGTVFPVFPGLIVVWLAALFAWLASGMGGLAIASMVVLTLLLIAGTAAKFVLASRGHPEDRPGRKAVLLAAGFGVAGFFVVPVVGFLVGAAVGIYLGERITGETNEDAKRRTLKAGGRYLTGMAVESGAGVMMVGVFVLTVLVTGRPG